MAGSKSEATLVLLYDVLEDKATWAIKSAALRAEAARPWQYYVVWDDDPNYSAIAKLAGPKPQVLVEEVSQHSQGDDYRNYRIIWATSNT